MTLGTECENLRTVGCRPVDGRNGATRQALSDAEHGIEETVFGVDGVVFTDRADVPGLALIEQHSAGINGIYIRARRHRTLRAIGLPDIEVTALGVHEQLDGVAVAVRRRG